MGRVHRSLFTVLRRHRDAGRAISIVSLLALLALLAAPATMAHLATYPIGATVVSVITQGDPSTWEFSFVTSGQGSILVVHDPTVEETSLLVRGTGANEGRTSLIRLNPGKWAPDGAGGYEYTDVSGADGGVTSVTYSTGSLSISASGSNWPWELLGPQDEVFVEFWIAQELYCAEFSSANAVVTINTVGRYAALNASAPGACEAPVCGNGVHELGEECDDGNFDNGDGCTDQCLVAACTSPEYGSTWEAIQAEVIGLTATDAYQCLFCHDAVPVGNTLDLTPANAYANMINIPATNFYTDHDYVEPGEPIASFLQEKMAAATNGTLLPTGQGNGMPPIGAPLTVDHLEAVSKWIRGGAPETGVVEGTAALLATCLPPATPLKIPAPDPPAPGTGVQLRQTAYDLPGESETEVCVATYYDFCSSGIVPVSEQFDCPGAFGVNNSSDKCFYYHRRVLVQDPQSHHSIIHIYQGDYDVSYEDTTTGHGLQDFGPFDYKAGPNKGQPCDPKAVDPVTGANNDCSGRVVPTLACLSAFPPTIFGVPDYGQNNANAPSFAGSQEPYAETEFAPGVYSVLPCSGVVAWNSHAFNLTPTDTTMEQYLNIDFAGPADRLFPAQAIFDSVSIFSENVPAYGTQEVCRTYTVEQGANVSNINSHTHRWGVQFRVWEPPQTACYPDSNGDGCSPGNPSQLIYYSTDYTDPVQLNFSPPVLYDSPNPEDRTFLYCSVYDNGSTPTSPSVKRQSTSPSAPGGLGPFAPGGPCADAATTCFGGANAGVACNGNDGLCDSGQCDACPVNGGVTTEDEMFIFIGTYYVPEPSRVLLLVTGLAGLIGLGRLRVASRRGGNRLGE
ncbi:MAG: hypothetical protein P8Q97_04465 [Myxococcota bacterium]|nr:hypothetical protein [Myxococcota bacterium]